MRIWAKVIIDHRIYQQTVGDFASPRSSDADEWAAVLHELCQKMDLCRPVILSKHLRDLQQFSRTVFKPADFMEPVDFDAFEVEILAEKKKRSTNPYSFA